MKEFAKKKNMKGDPFRTKPYKLNWNNETCEDCGQKTGEPYVSIKTNKYTKCDVCHGNGIDPHGAFRTRPQRCRGCKGSGIGGVDFPQDVPYERHYLTDALVKHLPGEIQLLKREGHKTAQEQVPPDDGPIICHRCQVGTSNIDGVCDKCKQLVDTFVDPEERRIAEKKFAEMQKFPPGEGDDDDAWGFPYSIQERFVESPRVHHRQSAYQRKTKDCISCGKRIHENDYPLDNSNSPLTAADYGYQGPDIPQCFACSNDEDSYTRGLERAKKRHWKLDPDMPCLSCKGSGLARPMSFSYDDDPNKQAPLETCWNCGGSGRYHKMKMSGVSDDDFDPLDWADHVHAIGEALTRRGIKNDTDSWTLPYVFVHPAKFKYKSCDWCDGTGKPRLGQYSTNGTCEVCKGSGIATNIEDDSIMVGTANGPWGAGHERCSDGEDWNDVPPESSPEKVADHIQDFYNRHQNCEKWIPRTSS